MPKLIFLGTSTAVPTPQQDNAHLAVVGDNSFLLIDTGSNPTARLDQAGYSLLDLTDVLVTHFHPDHAGGMPSLIMNGWLMGRKNTLNLYGLEVTLQRIYQNMDLYGWEKWPDFYPLDRFPLPAEERFLAYQNQDITLWTSPVRHLIPNLAVRVESRRTGKSVVYSSDTEPCPEVVRLAEGADVLVHESAGPGLGHTSPFQAGEIARQANVKTLYLIHYRSRDNDLAAFVAQAYETFRGPVILAHDYMEFEF